MQVESSHIDAPSLGTNLTADDLTPENHAAAIRGEGSMLAHPTQIKEAVTDMIGECQKHNSSGSLLLVHFSNLAMIINAYGHDMSEQVIRDITGRIQFMLSPKDRVFRAQRDQLMIALANAYPDDSESLASRIMNIVQNYGRDAYLSSALHVMAHISLSLIHI